MDARILSLCLMLQIFRATSQEVLPPQNQLWVSYLSETSIASSKISVNADLLEVPGAFLMATAGGSYSLSSNFKLTAAYAQLWFSKENPQKNIVEFRPYLQMTSKYKWRKFDVLHRLRYEARWTEHLVNDEQKIATTFKGRVRYFLQLKYPLFDIYHQKIYAFTANEVLFHLTKSISLDQERWSGGIGIQSRDLTIQLAYMYRDKMNVSDTQNQVYNTVCVTLFHHIKI
ncbi:MAG: DUF2490 domain-containing protein [Saprospiraceae bacterium]|nr:DUF2490 domain-containing protein [Saprospiraceae bacterium]